MSILKYYTRVLGVLLTIAIFSACGCADSGITPSTTYTDMPTGDDEEQGYDIYSFDVVASAVEIPCDRVSEVTSVIGLLNEGYSNWDISQSVSVRERQALSLVLFATWNYVATDLIIDINQNKDCGIEKAISNIATGYGADATEIGAHLSKRVFLIHFPKELTKSELINNAISILEKYSDFVDGISPNQSCRPF